MDDPCPKLLFENKCIFNYFYSVVLDIAGEMAQLIMTNQRKYAPSNMVNDVPDILMEVPMHGDQLFEQRCRNVQWTFQDGTSKYDRLEGITTEAADWHAKVNLYNVCLSEDKF